MLLIDQDRGADDDKQIPEKCKGRPVLKFVGCVGCCETTCCGGSENGGYKCLNMARAVGGLELFDDRWSEDGNTVDCDSCATCNCPTTKR
jgi:hypothetical protein